jgi:ABC-type multidrug transport system fused ATPase/permease subunit
VQQGADASVTPRPLSHAPLIIGEAGQWTVITIAYRLSTLRNFDRILVLHETCLMEDGALEQWLRANGLYPRLVNQELSQLTEIAA